MPMVSIGQLSILVGNEECAVVVVIANGQSIIYQIYDRIQVLCVHN